MENGTDYQFVHINVLGETQLLIIKGKPDLYTSPKDNFQPLNVLAFMHRCTKWATQRYNMMQIEIFHDCNNHIQQLGENFHGDKVQGIKKY